VRGSDHRGAKRSFFFHPFPFHLSISFSAQKYENSDFAKVRQDSVSDMAGTKKVDNDDAPPPLSADDLRRLGMEVAHLRNGSGVHDAPVDTVVTLLPILDLVVQEGITAQHQFSSDTIPEDTRDCMQLSLDAAQAVIGLMAGEHVDKQLLQEECIENCVQLYKHLLTRNILPILDPSIQKDIVVAKKSSAAGDDESDFSDQDMEDAQPKAGKGRGRGRGQGGKKTSAKSGQVVKQLPKLIRGVTGLLERLSDLLTVVHIEDKLILQLCASNLSTLFVDATSVKGAAELLGSMQIGALAVMQAIFCNYPRHRQVVLEDLFGLLRKLPNSKRSLRTYKISQGEEKIQMVTALVMLLLQSCVEKPKVVTLGVEEGGDDDDEDGETRPKKTAFTSGTAPLIANANSFISSFLQRCSQKDQGKEFQALLSNMVDDLLTTLNVPEWPASEAILKVLSVQLAKVLQLKAGDADEKGAKDIEASYCHMALDLMGRICRHIKHHISQIKMRPLTLPKAVDTNKVNLQGKPGQEGENDFCICGKGFQQAFMLDCDRCHRWFHGSCVGYDEERPPSEWVCEDCQIQHQIDLQKLDLERLQKQVEEDMPIAMTFKKRKKDKKDKKKDKKDKKKDKKDKKDRTPTKSPRSSPTKPVSPRSPTKKRTQPRKATLADELAPGQDVMASWDGKWLKAKFVGKKAGGEEQLYQVTQKGSAWNVTLAELMVHEEDKAGRAEEEEQAEAALEVELQEMVDAEASSSAEVGASAEAGGEKNVMEEADVFKQLFLNHVTERAQAEASVEYARRMYLAQWIAEEKQRGRWQQQQLYEAQWEMPKRSVVAERGTSLSRSYTIRIGAQLALGSNLYQNFDSFLQRIMALLGETQPGLRARTMKSLAQIVEVDPLLMGDEHLRMAITGRFLDDAISVRQAAVDLVGRHILYRSEFVDAYYGIVLERLLDKGVSVRKSVVKILRCLLQQPHVANSVEKSTEICLKLVNRIGTITEEETIKELILDTFQELWFGVSRRSAATIKSEMELDLPLSLTPSQAVTPSGGQVITDSSMDLTGDNSTPSKARQSFEGTAVMLDAPPNFQLPDGNTCTPCFTWGTTTLCTASMLCTANIALYID
jgi:hypothetical protein